MENPLTTHNYFAHAQLETKDMQRITDGGLRPKGDFTVYIIRNRIAIQMHTQPTAIRDVGVSAELDTNNYSFCYSSCVASSHSWPVCEAGSHEVRVAWLVKC